MRRDSDAKTDFSKEVITYAAHAHILYLYQAEVSQARVTTLPLPTVGTVSSLAVGADGAIFVGTDSGVC